MSDKVKITLRALEARAKRYALAKDDELLRKCRPTTRGYNDLGDYYFVDSHTNTVTSRGMNVEDLIAWCAEECIIKPFEEVVID